MSSELIALMSYEVESFVCLSHAALRAKRRILASVKYGQNCEEGVGDRPWFICK